MRIYDDVAVSDRSRSPTSTVTTEMCASSPTSSIGTQCPIYENIADFAPLTYSGSRGVEGSGPRGSSSLEKNEPLNMDFINNIPPPPLTAGSSELDKSGSDYGTGRRQLRPLDMRPLSLPASERKRLERKSNHALLAVFVSTVICMTMFALAIWYYYSDIVKHLKSAINSL
ncbi:unnamed protein product [Heligmosomoides polygyrus]|uniref:Conserved plasma membrane protein n=1 Tax=Heligmosomoides polygyrus TaxID=6339 RepID=A0A183FIE9_HELPZ|nr:unnamed protein product [Heligmosomoides polygyrus]